MGELLLLPCGCAFCDGIPDGQEIPDDMQTEGDDLLVLLRSGLSAC